MHKSLSALAALAGIALSAVLYAPPASAQGYGQDYGQGYGQSYGRYDEVIRCESIDNRTRECPTGDGRAILERQISNAPCIEGRSWGEGRRSVWVSNGCRADFRIQGYRGGYGGTVRCESHDGRYNRCTVPGRGRPQLVRQVSNSPCIEGRSWGADRNSVWVSQGCRADFASGRGGWDDSGYGGRVFRCESIDNRPRECPANVRSGVQLIRQLSNAPCIQGRSWGYGRVGIWVSNGCRAEFRSY